VSTFTLTIGGTDRKSLVAHETLRIEERAGVAVCNFQLLDKSRAISPPLDLELIITEAGVRSFGGFIREVEVVGTGRTRYYNCTARDYTSLLAEDAIPAGAVRTTVESDKARIEWLLTTYGTKGIVGGSTVQTVMATLPNGSDGTPRQDFGGMTLAEAIQAVQNLAGSTGYVDRNLNYHNYSATTGEGLTAPFNLSDVPNMVSTFPHFDLTVPKDTVENFNAVYVTGTGISGWRPNPPPSAATRRATVLRDEAITTQSQLDAAGDAVLAKSPAITQAKCTVLQPGLHTGMAVQVTSALHGLSAQSFMITNNSTTMVNPDTCEYAVTLGPPIPSLADIISGVGQTANDAIAAAQTAIANIGEPIANLQIGGANLFANSSFENSNDAGWTIGAGWAFGAAYAGAFDHARVAEGVVAAATLGNLDTHFVPVDRTTDYWFSIWSLLRIRTSGTAQIEILEYNAVPTLLATTVVASISAVQTAWTRHSIRFGPNTAYGRTAWNAATTQIKMRMRTTGSATLTWDVDAAQAERASVLSVYAPAPYELLDNQIVGPEIADSAIGTVMIADNAISAPKIQAGSIDANKLAANSVVAGKIAAGSISASMIAASGLVADVIRGGSLTVGGAGGAVVTVLDVDGNTIGLWDQTGLYITDPLNPLLQMKLVNGVLSFSQDAGLTWTTAISGQGISADAITLGTAPGGHNSIPNASMELVDFSTTITKIWTVAADWGTTIGTDVNVTKTGADLLQTTYTY
jgi:hypothetical protein